MFLCRGCGMLCVMSKEVMTKLKNAYRYRKAVWFIFRETFLFVFRKAKHKVSIGLNLRVLRFKVYLVNQGRNERFFETENIVKISLHLTGCKVYYIRHFALFWGFF